MYYIYLFYTGWSKGYLSKVFEGDKGELEICEKVPSSLRLWYFQLTILIPLQTNDFYLNTGFSSGKQYSYGICWCLKVYGVISMKLVSYY